MDDGRACSFTKAAADNDCTQLKAMLKCHPSIIDEPDEKGRTAVICATINDSFRCLKYLHNNGANLLLKDEDQKTALMYSVENKRCCFYLLDHLPKEAIDARDKHGWTALMYAVYAGYDRERIDYFLIQGADINAQNNKGETVIMIACASSRFDSSQTVEVLLARCPDLKVKDDSGKTALSHVQGSHPTIVQKTKLLLCSKAPINEISGNIENGSPMAVAVQNGDDTFLLYLLKKGADPKVWKYPEEDVHRQIKNGRCDIIQLLLTQNINPVNVTKSSMEIDVSDERVSPLETAVYFDKPGIALYFIACYFFNYQDIPMIQNHDKLRIPPGKSPWPLLNLAFARVSETARRLPGYKESVEHPANAKFLNLWKGVEKVMPLCTNLWAEIVLGFEKGTINIWADHCRRLEKCYCHKCNGKGQKFVKEKNSK